MVYFIFHYIYFRSINCYKFRMQIILFTGSTLKMIVPLFYSSSHTDEHDSLRKRYTDLVASHSAAASKLELAQEEMTRFKKQYEESIQERNAAIRERNVLKSQCTHAIMQWDIAIRERNTYVCFKHLFMHVILY